MPSFTAPFEPPKPAVPKIISMRQCRLQLLADGMLDEVDPVIAGMDSPQKEQAQIEWEYATEVKRNSALVLGIGAALKLTEDDLDTMFVDAYKL